jgi:hypothetical protein
LIEYNFAHVRASQKNVMKCCNKEALDGWEVDDDDDDVVK